MAAYMVASLTFWPIRIVILVYIDVLANRHLVWLVLTFRCALSISLPNISFPLELCGPPGARPPPLGPAQHAFLLGQVEDPSQTRCWVAAPRQERLSLHAYLSLAANKTTFVEMAMDRMSQHGVGV